MSIAQGFETITAIIDSDQISSSLHATKPLTQYLKKDTSDVSPDWTVAANQPVIYVRAKSQLEMTRKPIIAGTEKWYYNDTLIVFDTVGKSTSPAGLFQKESYDDGGVEVPALRIIGNLASTTNTDSDRIGFSGQVDIGTIKTEVCPEIDIRLEETVGDPYEGFIEASEGGVIDDNTDEITCKGILYKGGAEVATGVTYYWYFQKENDWTLIEKFNGKQTITVIEEDIDGVLGVKCDFYYGGSKVTSTTRQLHDETDPLIVSANPNGPTQLKSGESVKFTPKVIRRSNAQEVTGYSFSYALYDANDSKVGGDSSGSSITIDYATVLANRSTKLYISAKK
ncbi:MAG: hypothetical protein LIP01_08715 [Tannerellaceae bacterium]|nr:hypothetical protein [Tannerellaceae bacterium]